jgi:phospholipid-binding lipoprotein MlaA
MWGRFILDGVDKRSRVIDELDDLQRNSLDYYAQLRSIVRQHRAAELGMPLPTMTPTGAGSMYDDPQASAAKPAPSQQPR